MQSVDETMARLWRAPFRLFNRHRSEPVQIVLLRGVISLCAIAALIAYGVNLIVAIPNEHFSSQEHAVVDPVLNTTKYGMAPMPSVFLHLGGLTGPTIQGTDYGNINVTLGCWDNDTGQGTNCDCPQEWHYSSIVDDFLWSPSYKCNVCKCELPLIVDAIWVTMELNNPLRTSSLLLFDPDNQAVGSSLSNLNDTGQPLEARFGSFFSLYYNNGNLLRYEVNYSRRNYLKSTWRDILGVGAVYQPVASYAINSIPMGGQVLNNSYWSYTVLYPMANLRAGGQGYIVTQEFRSKTIPGALASFGGLWGLIEGIYVVLFGHTLLFAIFGTKPIAPFGLVGKFSKGLRRSLEKEYPNIQHNERLETVDAGTASMSALLLDFVLDISPLRTSSSIPEGVSSRDVERGEARGENAEGAIRAVERSLTTILPHESSGNVQNTNAPARW